MYNLQLSKDIFGGYADGCFIFDLLLLDARDLDEVGDVGMSDGEEGCPELSMSEQFQLIHKDGYFLCEVETIQHLAPCKFNT